MIRLKGPAASAEARGAIANALTFAKSKRGTYGKAYAAPAQPQTGAQMGVRVMVKFLSRWWTTLTPAEKDTWTPLSIPNQLAPYHAYMGDNMRRWRTLRSPSKEYPAPQILVATLDSQPQSTPGIASINVGVALRPATDNIAAVLFRGPTNGFPLTIDRVVQIIPQQPTVAWSWWLDTPLDPDTYWYCARNFTDDGHLGPASSYRKAILT